MARGGLLVSAFLACACDGPPGAQPIDATPYADVMPPPACDKPYAPGGFYKIYLSFDELMLTRGPDDASRNRSSLVPGPVTLTAFRPTALDREVQLQAITSGLQLVFGRFNVEITRTRPPSGDYIMVAFGGSSGDVGLTLASDSIAAINCEVVVRRPIMFVFDVGQSVNAAVNAAVEDIGDSLGIADSATPGDCMCNTPECILPAPLPQLCTIGGVVVLSPFSECDPGGTIVDEGALFARHLGCRP